jgi:hypothetical protein
MHAFSTNPFTVTTIRSSLTYEDFSPKNELVSPKCRWEDNTKMYLRNGPWFAEV